MISYHEIDGVVAYCIEPNVGSVDKQQYTSYDDGAADSASYWMLELDATQWELIKTVLAFGYFSGKQSQPICTCGLNRSDQISRSGL